MLRLSDTIGSVSDAAGEVSLAVVEQALRASIVFGFFAIMASYMICLFAAAAALTAASKNVALRAHTLTLQLAMADSAKVSEGELFERQLAADHCPAFMAFGIAISQSLGAKIAYVTISVALTLMVSVLNSHQRYKN